MNRTALLIFLLIASQLCRGQGFAINAHSVTIPDGFQLEVVMESDKKYLHEEWHPGTLFYPNGTTRDYEKIKFDRQINNLQIQVEAGKLDVYANLLSGFVIKESESIGHVFLVLDHEGKPAYYELLSNGPFQLLSYTWLFKDESLDSRPANDKIRFEKEMELIKVEEDIFVRTEGRMKVLKPNRKSVVKLTGQDKIVIGSFIKQNNLNLQLRSHMATLFNYINTL